MPYCECGCGGIAIKRFIHGHNARKDWRLRFEEKIHKGTECWEWQGALDGTGYGVMHRKGGGRRAHRIAYELWVGPVPSGLYVCHRCDNRRCCRPSHLFAGTAAENSADAAHKGRMGTKTPRRGERHHKAKLTTSQVREIRARYKHGRTQVSLAADFGVSQATISSIVRRAYWSHVGAEM